MSRGPVPSQLVLLSDLPSRSIGDKVRFLGCVNSYSVASGCLSMGHLYPPDANVVALVDVNLLLETLTTDLTRVGEYVNVIGYITSRRDPPGINAGSTSKESAHVSVQALVVWPTGPMDVQKYEKTFNKPE